MTKFVGLSHAVVGWVADRSTWAKVLLWVFLWPILGPLAVVAARPDSVPVRRAAAVWLAFVAVVGMASGASEPATDDPAAVAAPGPDTDTSAPAASPRPSQTPSEPEPEPSSVSPTPEATVTGTATPSPSPTPTVQASSEPRLSAGPRGDDAPVILQGRVVDIVDGDTIDLADGTRVRLAIVDTPEVHGGVETCGPEASEFTGRFLAGQTVAIYRLTTAPQQDRFGRAVGEVVRVTDGASLNVALVRAGLATVDSRFTSEDPDLTRRLRSAEAGADAPNCEPQATPTPTPSPTPTPDPAPPAPSGHTGKTDGGWDCHPAYQECLPQVGDLDCAEVGHTTHLLGNSDPYRLDGRSTSRDDGVGCESFSPWSASRTYPYY